MNFAQAGDDIFSLASQPSGVCTIRNCNFFTPQGEDVFGLYPGPRVVGSIQNYCEVGVSEIGCNSTNQVCVPRINAGQEWGVRCLDACPLGEFGSRPACTPCPNGKYGAKQGVTEDFGCSACDAGKFTNEAGATACANCIDFDESGDRKWSQNGSPNCLFVCSRGNRIDSLETYGCTTCEPGRYNLQPGGFFEADEANTCEVCDAGYFCSGGDSRLPCPRGRYGSEIGLESSEDCTPCPVGTFGNSEGLASEVECTLCSPGTKGKYVSAGAATKEAGCEECPSGSVSNAGSADCTPCEAGTWQNGTDCVACPAGYFGNHTGLFDEMCDGACPPGTHSYRYATKCQDCEAGKHAPTSSLEDCVFCDTALKLTPSLDATTCLCKAETYRDADGVCAACPEEIDCASIGNDLTRLLMKPDSWRPEATSEEFLACPFDGVCLGGVNASCAEGNEGVLCAICSEGYYRPTAFAMCAACGDNAAAAVAVTVAIVVAMVLGLVVLVAINRRAPNGLLRPIIDLVQRFSVMMLFNAPFPEELVKFGRVLSTLSFSLDVVAPECAGIDANFYRSFGTMVGLLAAVFCAMLLLLLPAKIKRGWTVAETLASDAAGVVFRDMFVVVFMVHPGLSGTAMQFFRCREIDGTSYLMADYSLECYDAKWWRFLPFVVLVLVTFSLGVPLGILYILRKRAAGLYDADGKPNAQALDIMYAIYRKEAYWYESVQMVFKLGLWSTVVFFEYKSEMQLATALVLNVLQLCVHIEMKPMGGPDARMLNIMQATGLVLTTYINFGGLAMNYLTVSRDFAIEKDEPYDVVTDYDKTIGTIQGIMSFFTFGLVFCVVAVTLKNAFMTIYNTSLEEVRVWIAQMRGDAAPPPLPPSGASGGVAVAVVSNPVPGGAGQNSVKIQMCKLARDSHGNFPA